MIKVEINKLNTFTGHKDSVYTIVAGIRASSFFSAGGDGMVVQWDLKNSESGRLMAKLPNSVYALAQPTDPGFLLVGQNFEGIHLIDLNSKKEVASLKLGKSAIFDIKIIGNSAYVGMGDGSLNLVDLNSMTIVKKTKPSEKSARTIACHHGNNEISVGFSDHKIRVFDAESLDLKHEIDAHSNSVFTLKYSLDETVLLSGSRDAHLKVWDTKDNYCKKGQVIAHMYAINDIAFNQDAKYFVTCSMDKSIKVWDAESFRLLKVIDKARHAGHGTSVNKLYWSAYKDLLVSCSDDRSISVWDVKFNE